VTAPAAARQRAHYDRIAGSYLASLAQPHTREYGAYLDRVVCQVLGERPLGRVAELCCGQGEALALLSGRIAEGVGVDVSAAMLAAAAARLPEARFRFVQADATRLPFADAHFDTLLVFGGVHHVPDRRALFAEAARVLRPGGRLLFREPWSDFAPWRWLRALVYRLSPQLDAATERPLRLRETLPPLEAAGLRLRAWRGCGFLGFCLLMNGDVLVVNRWLRFLPGIRAAARLAARLDEACLRLPGLRQAGLQVVGCAEKPAG
jgi:SAM-dependent methyltransferase